MQRQKAGVEVSTRRRVDDWGCRQETGVGSYSSGVQRRIEHLGVKPEYCNSKSVVGETPKRVGLTAGTAKYPCGGEKPGWIDYDTSATKSRDAGVISAFRRVGCSKRLDSESWDGRRRLDGL